jgi:signal transduction histidine kinase/DNA-binding NarL/FixJ family response regulator
VTMLDRPLRVLVVDDDAVDRETVRRALRPMAPGVEFGEATSIAEAERELEAEPFDCVVLDYLLPEGPCLDFIDRMRTTAPDTAFVVLTGQGDESVAVELMKAGAADYLSKDSLDHGRLRGAVKFAVALRLAQSMASAATAERDRHANQLKRFVAHAPEIVAARTIPTLARTTCIVARDVLEAPESCCSLRSDDSQSTVCETDGAATELLAWATDLCARGEVTSQVERSDGRAAVGVMARDGDWRGVLAVRLPKTRDAGTQEQLLCQLGTLTSVSLDNLLLYDAKARAVRARDDIMAVVSHDLRTPLNNVRLGASLLRDSSDESTRSVIVRVERNVALMARLVDDLVDMVRIESGGVELRRQHEPVGELLQAARDLILTQALAAEQQVDVAPLTKALYVRADRERVLQVLANLLGNAVKFSPAKASITLAAAEQAGAVCFEVRDSGRGIGKDEGDKVFARFWRSDPKRRRGLGLGLYIAKGLVQAHGGALWYESEEGQGTRFFFTLPGAGAEAQPTADA